MKAQLKRELQGAPLVINIFWALVTLSMLEVTFQFGMYHQRQLFKESNGQAQAMDPR